MNITVVGVSTFSYNISNNFLTQKFPATATIFSHHLTNADMFYMFYRFSLTYMLDLLSKSDFKYRFWYL